MSVASLGSNSVRVTGPAGYSQLATLVSAAPSSNAAAILATYRITRPAAGWGAVGSVYSVQVLGSIVADMAGNLAVATAVGTFKVTTG